MCLRIEKPAFFLKSLKLFNIPERNKITRLWKSRLFGLFLAKPLKTLNTLFNIMHIIGNYLGKIIGIWSCFPM